MLRSATTRSARLLLLQRSHAASLSQGAGAGAAGCSSPPFLTTATSTTSSSAFSYPACQGDADAQDRGRIDRYASAQGVVTQRQPTSIGSARGGLTNHSRVGSSFLSLLGVLPRPSGYLVPSLASAQAHLKRSLSSHAEQPAESPVAEDRKQEASLETVADGQSVAPKRPRRYRPLMPYNEGLPQAWPAKVQSAGSVKRAPPAPPILPDDGTITSALRIYQRERARRKLLRHGNFSDEQHAQADAAVQKSRGIYNSRRADPLHAEEEAQRKAKRNAVETKRRKLVKEGSPPSKKTPILDEDAPLDRRLYPLYLSAPPDDHSIAAARAQQRRAQRRLEHAQAAQLDAEKLATFEQAVQTAKDACAQRYRDPRNAEEREAKRASIKRPNDEQRKETLAKAIAKSAQRRASKGLAPFISVDNGLVKCFAEHAASQGRTLPPRGTDDGSATAAYRMYGKAVYEVSRLQKKDAHSEDVSKALAARQQSLASFKARLEDPANAEERQVYDAWKEREKKRRALQRKAEKAASKPDAAPGQA